WGGGGRGGRWGGGAWLAPVPPPAVDEGAVEQADRARPELVVLEARGAGEQVHRLAWWDGAGIAGLADDPHEAVLGDRARGPAVLNLGVDPVARGPVIDMVSVEQSQQDVDVQQRASHSASSSRSRSISAFEIASPRFGRGSNPWKDSAARSASAGASWPVNAWRARSDRTSPAVRFSRRARSLTPRSTAASRGGGGRLPLMRAHLCWDCAVGGGRRAW